MLISQHMWEVLAYTITAGLTQSLGFVCGLRQTQLACILTMLYKISVGLLDCIECAASFAKLVMPIAVAMAVIKHGLVMYMNCMVCTINTVCFMAILHLS